jgi:hypothetical protein
LKALAPLLGITSYDESHSLSHYRYPSPNHPDLFDYNAKDAWATLKAVETLEDRIRQSFPDSSKLSPYAYAWYSQLIWTALSMEESGIAFDAQALDDLDFTLVLKSALIYSECVHRYGFRVSGKGSHTDLSALYLAAVEEANLVADPRLEYTEKRRELSINQANAALILQHLDPGSRLALSIHKHQQYESFQKTVTSYTRPMLHGTAKNPTGSRLAPPPRLPHLRRGAAIAYPSWFLTPSQFDSGIEGGTMQGRITSKGPACQTFPPIIKKCMTSRYDPGFFLMADLSQIEMRGAALLSGDPLMLQEYRDGVDRHSRTGVRIAQAVLNYMDEAGLDSILLAGQTFTASCIQGYLTADNPRDLDGFKVFRQAGKTQNFLVIYGGSANRLQGTFAADLGISLPLEVCDTLIQVDRQRYSVLAAWQNSLIQHVSKTNRYELPLTGQSRVFLGSPRVVRNTYTSEILNFPIQTVAANILLDIQARLTRLLYPLRPQVFIAINVFDALGVDGPLRHYRSTLRAIEEAFSSSDYLARLQDHLDRTIPLSYDITVLSRTPIQSLWETV